MSFILSTGLVNFLAAGGSLRKAFDDCVCNIYSGAVPVTAEEAPGSGLLCPITIGSVAVAATDRSIPKIHHVTFSDNHAPGDTCVLSVNVDSIGVVNYTYTNTPDAGTAAQCVILIARMINDIPQLCAIPDVTAREMYVMSRINGLDFTLAYVSGNIVATVDAAVQAASRAACAALWFGPPTIGLISIAGSPWSGVNLQTGIASFFRFVRPDDQGNQAGGSTAIRLQGTISTSGADMNLSNTTLTIAATTTIDSGNFEEPRSE